MFNLLGKKEKQKVQQHSFFFNSRKMRDEKQKVHGGWSIIPLKVFLKGQMVAYMD
jgi:hypothetical protein